MEYPFAIRGIARHVRFLAIPVATFLVFLFLGVIFFVRARDAMRMELRERLRTAAAVAAMQFDGRDIQRIGGPESMTTPVYRDLVARLARIRDAIPHARYAYIMRRTADPMTVEFVADADGLQTFAEQDANGNGVVDPEEELSFPGDPYDVTEVPPLQGEAFLQPTVDKEETVDQWGRLVSGYAPVRRGDTGQVVGVVGIDMKSDVFWALTTGIFSPLGLLIVLLIGTVLAGHFIHFTWKRRLELQQRLEEERSGILELTFHQLGEPLTIFKWSVEGLKEHDPKEPMGPLLQEHIANVEEGIARMNHIIDALIEAEHVERGTLHYNPEAVSVIEVVHEIIHILQPRLERHKQRVDVRVPLDLAVRVDRKLIAGVIRELVHNAISFSPEGATIIVGAERHNGSARIFVKDSGCGIPKRDLPRIFSKYARASNAGQMKPDGNGLGLYIAKGVVERAGGTISLTSTEERGTTVAFTLPRA